MSESSKPTDVLSQFMDLASLWMPMGNPFRTMMSVLPTRYEVIDPRVQEIAILAAMHNMASLLHNPEKIKAALKTELSERAIKLGEDK